MREHGTRAKYVVDKCRCEPCTVANRLYQRERDRHARRVAYGIEPPQPAYIDATETREHLRWLKSKHVGTRTISIRTGIARTTIWKIMAGTVTKIRPETADKLLAVGRSTVANGALVDAKDTWRRIDDLVRHGWTKAAIECALGGRGRALQIGKKRVRASTARAVEQLHATALLPVIVQRENDRDRQRRLRERQAA